MTPRDVMRCAVDGKRPPYVPWQMGFTLEAYEKLETHFGHGNVERALQNHTVGVGNGIFFTESAGPDRVSDPFGVIWDRSVDEDIGVVANCVLPEPSMTGYSFPDPLDPRIFKDITSTLAARQDHYHVFYMGFSLYERAWCLRGMENLMVDFIENPGFVHDLLGAITDYNLAQIREALKYDIDAVQLGDDWGQQSGLQMGPGPWRKFIKPCLARMYGEIHKASRKVFIHSCGKVDELFDDLVEIGLNCFNPFQPEVMDAASLMKRYHGRLAFFGGLSTQRTLPYGKPDDVRKEVKRLVRLGSDGGYIFAPAHSVEGDVSIENLLSMIETIQAQPGYKARP